ncbi:MAG: sulfite exporter TauE/SafE family protein [Paracoccaceae bacterium]
MDLSSIQYVYIALAAFLIGFSKTSVEVGILGVLLVALVIPGKASPGIVLPMLIAADIAAVLFYRRSCKWGLLVKLIPAAFVGVALGAGFLWAVPNADFEKIIGGIILAMLVLDLAMTKPARKLFRGPWVARIFGTLGGAASMIANAAGPVFGVYLLQMGLNKREFVGTRGWFFLIMNVSKLPFAVGLGLITPQTLLFDLTFLPAILVGAVTGYVLLSHINQRLFSTLIRVAVLGAAARLILA